MNFRITGFDDIGSHTHYSINKVGEHYEVRADNYKCGRTVSQCAPTHYKLTRCLRRFFFA